MPARYFGLPLHRDRRAIERRIRQANFPVVKSLDSFEFLAIPSLNKRWFWELSRCEFLSRKEDPLLLGNKWHGQNSHRTGSRPGRLQARYLVRFTSAAALVSELIEAHD